MEWRSVCGSAMRWWALLLPLIASTVITEEVLPSVTTSLQTITASSLLPTATPTPTSIPTEPPTHTPHPTSPPGSKFIRYRDDFLYLDVDEIKFEYRNVSVFTGNFSNMEITHTNVSHFATSITFKRYYSYHGKPYLTIYFAFARDPEDATWYVENFRHQNLTESDDMLFQYKGLQYSIVAPLDKFFLCNSPLIFHGISGPDTNVNSTLTLQGLTVQAFIRNGNLSPVPVQCGKEPSSHTDFNVGIVIGVVSGVCIMVLIAVVIVAASLFVKKARRRGYNLLDTR